MSLRVSVKTARMLAMAIIIAGAAASGFAAVKNMAIVAPASSKLNDVALADLAKLCKGTLKAWPDGKNFVIVMKNPDAPEMGGVVQKLFGVSSSEAKAAIANLNEGRTVVKIVENDEDVLRVVEATPGAVGVVDVYAITSSVKVLRVDGKLPFDVGYALKGN